MKRYKLKKDLPTFKAGDEFIIETDGSLYYMGDDETFVATNERIKAYDKTTLEKFPNILEDWFEEVKTEPWKPKKFDSYYIVNCVSRIEEIIWVNDYADRNNLVIGNCFKTKEDAEEVVEKLKAFKRLRDAGFKFTGYSMSGSRGDIGFTMNDDDYGEYADELNLLFGDDDEQRD